MAVVKGLGQIYFEAVMSIIAEINTGSWDQWKSNMSVGEFVHECATITLRGPRGTGHTQFALKMLKETEDCVAFTYNAAAKKNLSQGKYVFYNILDEREITEVLRTSPRIIVLDSIEEGDPRLIKRSMRSINAYVYGAHRPVFLVITGR